jgi:hypothetical protein
LIFYGDNPRYTPAGERLFFSGLFGVWGIIPGYLAGVLIGGVFLVAEVVRGGLRRFL